MSYGITDRLNFFAVVPTTKMSTKLAMTIERNGEPVGDVERAIFQAYLKSNGRPMPGTSFSGNDMGDIRTGVSWNFHREEHFSAAVVPHLIIPTGHNADPNNDIRFLRGPELDRGTHAWATGMTTILDARPVRWVVFSLELTAGYRFAYDRKAPKWLPITDCARISDASARAEHCSAGSPAYDQLYDLQQSGLLPNMEGLGKTYRVDPGISTGVTAAVSFDFYGVGAQVAWQFERNEGSTFHATGDPAAAAAFQRFTTQLGFFAGSEVHAIGVAVRLPLFPLYLPIVLKPNMRWIVAGKSTVKLDGQYGMSAELFLPVTDAL